MKYVIFAITLCCFTFSVWGQNDYYAENFKKETYKAQEVSIEMLSNEIYAQGEVAGSGALAAFPTVIDLGVKGVTSYLEKREKKFSAEYSGKKTNKIINSQPFPDIQFTRKLLTENEKRLEAVSFLLKAHYPEGYQNAFYYRLENMDIKALAAKVSSKKSHVDFTIKITVTTIVDGEKKAQELSPIQISGLTFNQYDLTNHPFYSSPETDLIMLPDGAAMAEISITVIESNPAKVQAENILALWNDNKDDIKTIINNFLPKEDESSNNNGDNADSVSSED